MNIPPPDQEAIAKEWAKRHPGFIREDSDLLKNKAVKIMKPIAMTKRYICAYCKKEFAYKVAYQKHLTRCTVQLNNDTIKPLVKDNATKVQPSEFIDGRPIDGKAIDDMAAKMSVPLEDPNAYAPSTAYDYTQTFGTPAKITAPAVSRKVDAVYYLLVAILSTILLCGLISAALGIKLLAGL
jgi:hypothetical protein